MGLYSPEPPAPAAMPMMKTPDPLDDLITSWKEVPAATPGLRRRVWARIDAAQKPQPVGFLQQWRDLFASVVRQRAVIGWVAACIVLGLISAELRATRQPIRDLGQIAVGYLQTINPLLRDSAGGPP